MNDEAEIAARVAELAALLEARKLRVSTAESCTGGWLAKCLTDQPGSSAWFEFGFVTDGNNAKLALLGVREETLAANTLPITHNGIMKRSRRTKNRTSVEVPVSVLIEWSPPRCRRRPWSGSRRRNGAGTAPRASAVGW